MPNRPRPLAHRFAAFTVAGLFSLGVLGATFRDTTRSIFHSAALPMFARVTQGEPGADWTGADAEVQYAAERARAAAELARARAETEAAKADLARLSARTTRERVRLAEAKRRERSHTVASGSDSDSAIVWASPGSFTFVAPSVPAAVRMREQMAQTIATTERAPRVTVVREGAATGCATRDLGAASARLDAGQRELALLSDLPRRLAVKGDPDAITAPQADSIAKYVVARLDTAGLRALRMHASRFACG
jgi:hypothetical protein